MASSSSSVQVLETESRRENLRNAILSLLWEWRHFDDQLACMNPASVVSSGFEGQQFCGGGLYFENKLKEMESKEAYFVNRAKELDFQEDSVKRRAQLLDLKEKEIEIREGGLCFAQSFVQERAKELDAQQKLIDARVKQLELKEKQIFCVKTEQFMHNSCNYQGSEGALPRSSTGTCSTAAVISNSARDQSVFRQQDDFPTGEDVTVSRVISEGVICPYIGLEADSNHTVGSDPVTMAGGAGYEIGLGHVPIEDPNGGVELLKFRESEILIRSSSRIRHRNLGVLPDDAHSKKKFYKSRSSTDGKQEQTQQRPIHTEKFKVNNSSDIPSASNAAEGNVKKNRCASTNPLDLNSGKEKVYESSEYTFNLFNRSDPALYDFPDPEFSNFDKDKEARCFTVGQIWAIYDIIDSMPRFYAEILKVHSPRFKLLIMWLDADPENQDEISWVDNGLPVSCGKFKLSVPEETSDRLMFSHQVYIERSKGYYGIYPRKGETWALFKDWDIRWNSEPEKHKKFSFEIVEILSGNVHGAGIRVVYLEKIKGFVSLFKRVGGIQDGSVLISSKEILRFSHRIPSFKMSGFEREGVPKCSVELDPAALPMDVIKSPGVCASFSEVGKFDRGKSANKFQPGQIWAVYSCADGMPKTYVQIMKVESSPFKLHAALLEPCSRPKQLNSCGIFEVQPRSTRTFPPEFFSHEVKVGSYCKNIYGIYPREGEIWAVYKPWNTKRSFSDRKKNECEIVQILKNKDTCIEVSCLVQMTGAACIFKALRTKNSMTDCLKIQRGELSLFSHQIPAIQRIGENNYWELDPASVPDEALFFRGCRMERPRKRPR